MEQKMCGRISENLEDESALPNSHSQKVLNRTTQTTLYMHEHLPIPIFTANWADSVYKS